MAWQPKKTTAAKDTANQNQNEDFCIPSHPSDGVTSISINNNANMLIAGSWDNSVSCYELQINQATGKVTNAIPQMQTKHEGPVLCTDIAPVRCVRFVMCGDWKLDVCLISQWLLVTRSTYQLSWWKYGIDSSTMICAMNGLIGTIESGRAMNGLIGTLFSSFAHFPNLDVTSDEMGFRTCSFQYETDWCVMLLLHIDWELILQWCVASSTCL